MKRNYKSLSGLITGCLMMFSIASEAQSVTYSFTTAGNTGSLGPTSTQVTNAYALTTLSTGVAVSNGIQSWTVPSSGLYEIEAFGAEGGASQSGNKAGGLGARMRGEFNLNAGQVLQILVGQMGEGGCGNGGGGGGSYVSSAGLPLVVAGGGGGASSDMVGVGGVTTTAGTFDNPAMTAGGSNGAGGNACQSGSYNGGGGGGFIAGTTGNGQTGSAGGGGGISFLNGGTGGAAYAASGSVYGGFGGGGGGRTCTVGGGGGGGYSGGAGGQHLNQCTTNARSGGGGGGSFNGGTNQNNTASVRAGNGVVIIRSLCNITLVPSANPVCVGNTVTLTTNAVSNYTWSNGIVSNSIVITATATSNYSLVGTSSANCVASAAIQLTVSNAVPALTVTASSPSVCIGQSASLTAAGALSYSWTNGVVNAQTFTPATTQVYTVTGYNGCGSTSSTISIVAAPLPVAVSITPTVNCAGYTSTLNAVSSATGYTWSPIPVNLPSAVVSPTASTVYSVSVTDGTCSGSGSVALLVNPVPTINIVSTSSNVCQGSPVTMTASGASNYTWMPGQLSGTVITVSPNSPTLFIASGVNSFGCKSSANQVVLTTASPTVVASSSDPLVCSGSTVALNATGATNYTWSTGAQQGSIIEAPTTSTFYVVSGTSANFSCTGHATVNVSVFTPTVLVTGNPAVCIGNMATITASGADTYTWDNGMQMNELVVTPTIATVYTVSASTFTDNIACSTSETVLVSVNPLPSVTIVPTRTLMCPRETNTLTASGGTAYLWTNNQAVPSITIGANAAVTLNYSVTVTDANGCKNIKGMQMKISVCSGIDDIESDQLFNVYPNPSFGAFTIVTSRDTKLTIMNELGQHIRTVSSGADNDHKVLVENLSPGLYFVTGEGFTTKVIVH